jgi:hypothetical protein
MVREILRQHRSYASGWKDGRRPRSRVRVEQAEGPCSEKKQRDLTCCGLPRVSWRVGTVASASRWLSGWELSENLSSTFLFISSLSSYHDRRTRKGHQFTPDFQTRLPTVQVTHRLQPALSRPASRGLHSISITIRNRVGVGRRRRRLHLYSVTGTP